MNKVLPTMPVSDLRVHQATIFAKLNETPVLLTQRGHGAGVLVHPDLWNEIIEQLEDYEDLLIAKDRQAEAQQDSSVMRPISDLRARLAVERPVPTLTNPTAKAFPALPGAARLPPPDIPPVR